MDPVVKRIVRSLDDAQRVWDAGGLRVGIGPKVRLFVHDVRRLVALAESALGNAEARHMVESQRGRIDAMKVEIVRLKRERDEARIAGGAP